LLQWSRSSSCPSITSPRSFVTRCHSACVLSETGRYKIPAPPRGSFSAPFWRCCLLRVPTLQPCSSRARPAARGRWPFALRRPQPELLTGKEVHSTSRGRLRQVLVTVQIAVSLVLLAGAGLLLRSLWKLEMVSLGMDARSVITAGLDLAQYRYPDSAKQLAFFSQLESRLKQMPGVTALGLSDTLP